MNKVRVFKLVRNIIIVIVVLLIIIAILNIAPNYKNEEITDRTNLVINSNNVTAHLKNDVFVEDGVVYISRADVSNFFDPYIFYDKEEKRIVTTSKTQVASLVVDKSGISINGKEYTMSSPAKIVNDVVYLPFSLMENIYSAEVKYIEATDIVNIETLTREKTTAIANSNISVKSRKKFFSRTVDKVEKDNEVVLISTSDDGWAKIRTNNGKIGYVNESDLSNITIIRETQVDTPAFEGKVNLIWDDYYSEYLPNRKGTTIPGLNVIAPRCFDLVQAGQGKIEDRFGSSFEYARMGCRKQFSNLGNII